MRSRQVLQYLGLTKDDVLEILSVMMQDLSLDDLNYILASIELEIQYREENDLLDEDDYDE